MSKKILVLGAGRSSAALIEYLARTGPKNDWNITIGDQSETAARQAIAELPGLKAVAFDIRQESSAREIINGRDTVISLLPAHLHPQAGKFCIEAGAHLITASYVSDEMRSLSSDAKQAGLLFLNECGLDPGIDHMSAMEMIHRIQQAGGEIETFRSFTGGLIAPDTDPENPWRYKFTWNARNVVMAGQGFATYREDGNLKRIPYQQLFTRTVPIDVPGTGKFDGYANRDSLKYCHTYGLSHVKTMIRGTLRYHGYCQAWNVLVQLGCCEDQGELETAGLTHLDFMNFFVPSGKGTVQERIANQLYLSLQGDELRLLGWSGLFDEEPIGLNSGTPAQILEHILNKKWKMKSGDLDQIVMWHQLVYKQGGKIQEVQATLVSEGLKNGATAMARTVGLPLGIVTRLLLENKISLRGVQIPVMAEIYKPVLHELKEYGISLNEYLIK